MSLLPAGSTTNKVKSYCVFNAVQPFDTCRRYSVPCTPDNVIDDGFFICEGHMLPLKLEKMVLPINDADGNTFNRTIAKSLVSHTHVGDERILVPTKNNYQTVLRINNLSYAEQLVWHMIYENEKEQQRVCKLLETNERFEIETYAIAETIYSKTSQILAMTNPKRYCSRVDSNTERVWGTADENNLAGIIFLDMPPFMQNFINKAVAPEKMRIENDTLLIRECPTCHIRETGLVADVVLYNPVVPKYSNRINQNVLQIENVLKFKGNARALQYVLRRYEPYPVVVPLFLGEQIVTTVKTLPPAKSFQLTDLTGNASAPLPSETSSPRST
ncbi:vp39 capsid [Artaxa digramma nucleopolyhedrovirus]|uniref:Vp39 capsid n=1 Tax=Artaxa digramma nucleopolyhedrovirus TaxID=3070910 RepID=A0AAE6R6X9_9ABAC|nr:vp39 capsid [Euproctis digramma nucleopolyhedrovirus]QHB21739.1 vp39 capsid [Artaxa digramma nucleopolyhedrovirus]